MLRDPLRLRRLLLAVSAAVILALAVGACGDTEESTSTDVVTSSSAESTSTQTSPSSSTETTSSDSTVTESTGATTTTTPASTTPTSSGSCSAVETFEVEPSGTHFNRRFSAADYATNPPTAGDHNPTPIELGKFYDKPPALGETVHALEHGAVIGWTNGLDSTDEKAVERAFEQEFRKGYYQVAVVADRDLEVPFAMSSWDSLQRCDDVDPDAISSFIEKHYAPSSTGEGSLACSGKAAGLPACRTRTGP